MSRALRIGVSRQTALRLIRRTPCADAEDADARVVGIDDWAWKRGHRYGTVICDLERRRPLDLLPGREVASTVAWLERHLGIAVVSRDRGGIYADAAGQGAPEAVQVADRWHVLKNLGDALEQFLRRERIQLPAGERGAVVGVAEVVTTDGGADGAGSPASRTDSVTDEPTPSGAESVAPWRRQERFARVHARHRAGASIRAIADELGMARNTVRRDLRTDRCPDWRRGRRCTRLDRYREYLLRRWDEGCHNGSELFREIRGQGYRGGAMQVGAFVARLRQQHPAEPAPSPAPRPPSPRDLRWLLARRPDDLDDEGRAHLHTLLAARPSVAAAYGLVQRFAAMVREPRVVDLEAWLADAATSGIAELVGFVQGLRRDQAAVEAGMTLEWSQGQVEGQITRLKLLKRQMYGRASFDLLRQRVLYRAEAA